MSSDDNLLKNYMDSDSAHQVPDLMDQKTTKKIENDVLNDLFKGHENAKTTETDMLVNYIVNEDKLKPKDDRKEFVKPSKSKYDSDSEKSKDKKKYNDSSDSLNDHRKKDSEHEKSSYQPSRNTETETRSVKKVSNEFASDEEERLAKLDIMMKLRELVDRGVVLTKNYSMADDYHNMKWEYEMHKAVRDKHNGTKWLANLMLNVCWGVEIGNEHFNPFDFKLKGWSEQMSEDVDDYYEVMGELYEKYFKAGSSIPPEIKLFFMISGSAIKFHFAQTMVKSMPSLSDQMTNNPQLVQQLRQQAMNQKSQAMNQKLQEQHDVARQKVENLNMLKEKELEYLKQQEIQNQTFQQQMIQTQMAQMQRDSANKQKQIEELQRQLANTRSDTRSNYTGGFSNPVKQTPSNVRVFSADNKTQKTMKPPMMPASLASKMQETARQNSIMQQKTKMMQDERIKDNESNDSQINFNPNLDNIIKGKLNRDNTSQFTDGSTFDADEVYSDDSKVVKKRRGRKPKVNIKIDTNSANL